MNFVSQLEESLRDLAAEARKRHPGVKEASERATLTLRHYKNRYVSAVRQANNSDGGGIIPAPTTKLFQSSELLHPFLLAANYPNASPKLLEISFKAIRLLLEADAVVPTDAIHLLRVWMIQAQVVAAYYQKNFHPKIIQNNINNNQHHRHSTNSPTISHKEHLDLSLDSINFLDDANDNLETSSTTTTSSSWFSWYSSSSATPTNNPSNLPANSSHDSTISNAVSSSTGQTGHHSSSHKEMEKIALDILSSLLQLMQGMHRHYPQYLLADAVLWKHAFAVMCLLLSPYMTQASSHTASTRKHPSTDRGNNGPALSIVQQAAHSTLLQILTLLYEPVLEMHDNTNTTPLSLDKYPEYISLRHATWQDLLQLTKYVGSTEGEPDHFQGAFSLCKTASTGVAGLTPGWGKHGLVPFPPSPILALQVITKFWRNCDYPLEHKLAVETLAITAFLLRYVRKTKWVEATHAVLQWAFLVLSKLASSHWVESHSVVRSLLQLVVSATDSCRSHPDFEDGFTYSHTYAATDGTPMTTSRSSMTQPQNPSHNPQPPPPHAHNNKLLHSKPLIAESALGKANLALDVLHRLLLNDPNLATVLIKEGALLGLWTETLSDFATLAASCQSHVLFMVDFVASRSGEEGQEQQQQPPPTSFLRKVEYDVANADWESLVDAATLGEALWMALKGVLTILDFLGKRDALANEEQDQNKEPAVDVFGPSLAVFQHYLKRFSGCDVLVRLPLEGYLKLARLCFPSVDMQKALLTSLCKLSLPSWGKRDVGACLEDNHISSLLCIFEIMHHFHSYIAADWEVVLMTLEELSSLSIASPNLTDEAYHAALTISSLYGRVAAFSTCFSTESLLYMVQALCQVVETSLEADTDFLVNSGKGGAAIYQGMVLDSSSSPEKESFSKQILNIGVRAIYGSPAATSASNSEADERSKHGRTRNRFYDEYRQDFVKRLAKSKTTIRLESVGRVPFTLALIADVAMCNTFRYQECGEKISAFLSNLAARSAPVRPFLMDTIAILTMAHISMNNDEGSPAAFVGPGRIVFQNPMQSQLLAVEFVQSTGPNASGGATERRSVTQTEVLGPLCESLRSASKPDVAESALETLHSVLETAGHNLSGDVWTMVIDTLSSLSGDSKERSSAVWSKCSLDAFRCLRFVVNDFMDELRGETGALLDCCSSFGSSKQDVNSSLTAITMLWTIADDQGHSGTDSIDRALAKLLLLATDDRLEVRNASVNTLFSCINGRGATFTSSRWESCFQETIFRVYEQVSAKTVRGQPQNPAPPAPGDGKKSRYKVSLHYSRDSESKQWIHTQVVVLRGLARVLRTYFPKLLDTTDLGDEKAEQNDNVPWFQDAWVQILDYAYEAAAQGGDRDTLELRLSGVELIALCCQLSSKGGIQSVGSARVGTNMEVVDGALRTVARETVSLDSAASRKQKRTHSTICEVSRRNFFLEAFETLESYIEFLGHVSSEAGLEDTQIQVIHKFSTSLVSLYACSKDGELLPTSNSRCVESFRAELGEKLPESEGDLEGRFVKMLFEVVKMSTLDIQAKFLNQAQRSCIQLLKTMGNDGSCDSLRHLVDLGNVFFFLRKDSDAPGSSDELKKSESVGLEAVSAVCEVLNDATPSPECKIVVLWEVLGIFKREGTKWVSASRQNKGLIMEYKRMLPVIVSGLSGCTALEETLQEDTPTKSSVQCRHLIDATWGSLIDVLSIMMTPISMGNGMLKISHVLDLVDLTHALIPKTPLHFASPLCEILVKAASSCLEVAELHERCSIRHADKDVAAKSKEHRDELILLFAECFTGSCKLQPDNAALGAMSKKALEGAVHVMFSSKDEGESYIIDATLCLCQCVRELDGVEVLLPNLFPSLCKLMSSQDSKVRSAVADTLGADKTGTLLQTAQMRLENAERMAVAAEDRAKSLEAQVRTLKLENARLRKDLAVLEASSAL